ncbi:MULTISPECIES: universal stress protein [unclassified Blastococcus]|uniref:universal stress protein n=1 Tax=unclassified Blastococcus TaxID=2619396 RepID=UPI001EEFFAA3|nr:MULTISPECIES: universal stress protein [unclassified Blastococcus]
MTETTAQQPTDPGGSSDRARLVVGIDGSEHSRGALGWALAEAARRSAALDVVTTFPVDFVWGDAYLLEEGHVESMRAETAARARAFLDDVRRATAQPDGDVPVDLHVVAGRAAEELVRWSDGAELLVVGSRGRGAVRSTVLGSVALQCSVHARCPVVVVRSADQPHDDRVVVGLDDSTAGRAALRRGAEEARRRGGRLEVVVASTPVDTWTEFAPYSGPSERELREDAERFGRQVADEVLDTSRGEDVRVVAGIGPADDVLVDRARGAALLVVGSRSRSRLAGIVLGSVALRTVVRAECPVMVVHPPRTEEAAGPAMAAAATQG